MPTGPPPPRARCYRHSVAARARRRLFQSSEFIRAYNSNPTKLALSRRRLTLLYERPARPFSTVPCGVLHWPQARVCPAGGQASCAPCEPFERHIYLKGTLTCTQAQHHPRPILPYIVYPSQRDPLRGSGRSAHPKSHAPYSMPRTRYPAQPLHRCHSRSHGRAHRAQGARRHAVDYLHVNLDGCFAEGQAYVAISRACARLGFKPSVTPLPPLIFIL
jgi:hypothetical protein